MALTLNSNFALSNHFQAPVSMDRFVPFYAISTIIIVLNLFMVVIKRLPAAKKPKKDMNACTDALFAVLKGHFLAFACQELDIENRL